MFCEDAQEEKERKLMNAGEKQTKINVSVLAKCEYTKL